MGIIPNFMPNPKTAVFPTAVLFYTVNGPDGPVDYDASPLWITMLRRCGLRCFASVDYDASHLWITMLRICGLQACRPCGLVD